MYNAPDLTAIAQNNVLKDLGFYMSEAQKHTHNMVAKRQRMGGWVTRTVKS